MLLQVDKIGVFAEIEKYCGCFFVFFFFFSSKTPQKNSHTQNPKTLKAKPKTPCCTNQAVKAPIHTLIVRGRVSEFCAVSLVWFGFGFCWVSFYCIVLCGIVVAYVALFCEFFSFFHSNFALHFWMVAFFSFFFFF
jgi:hypothetical protein